MISPQSSGDEGRPGMEGKIKQLAGALRPAAGRMPEMLWKALQEGDSTVAVKVPKAWACGGKKFTLF